MDSNKLKDILDKHLKWLRNEDGGSRADLRGADLFRANLCGADLRGADLCGANLRGANLRGADLRRADLCDANLCDANLCGADLRGANLCGADLRGADLRGADLRGADLEISLVNKFFPLCCPEHGSFIAWKKSKDGYIVKLEVAENARRSSAFGRKCRCSEAKVLAIETRDGRDVGVTEVRSKHDYDFIYRVGETVSVDNFDDDRRNECAAGIHFFITRQEAVDYI